MRRITLPLAFIAMFLLGAAPASGALPSLALIGSACQKVSAAKGMRIDSGSCCRFACNQYKCFCLWWC